MPSISAFMSGMSAAGFTSRTRSTALSFPFTCGSDRKAGQGRALGPVCRGVRSVFWSVPTLKRGLRQVFGSESQAGPRSS